MSEYQYYEFVAVDHPLTPHQQAELRGYSTRAHITASGFTNEYHWGDLKGDSLDWMRRYFDAHVYSANWGSCCLMLRLPRAALDKAELAPFTRRSQVGARSDFVDAFAVAATPEHWILEWRFNDDSGEIERFWSQADGPGWMARLLPLRDELLRGDARPLYLGWLARVGNRELAEEDEEPPVPPGLNDLTPAQAALVDFLLLDPDWLAAAAEASPAAMAQAEASAMDAWLDELSPAAMRATLRLLLESRGQEAERGLRQEFLAWLRARQGSAASAPRRDVAEIEMRSEVCELERLAREGRRRTAAEAQRQADRARALSQLAECAGEAWSAIDQTLQRGSGAAYDQALDAVQALAEALSSAGRAAEFQSALARLMTVHQKRGAWVSRLSKAGFRWVLE